MNATMTCQIIGQWRITGADLWDRDHLALVAPAMMTIRGNGSGKIAFSEMQATLELEYSRTRVFFAWAGFDEMDGVTGSGSAALIEDGTLEIAFACHQGDEAMLRAEPTTSSTAC